MTKRFDNAFIGENTIVEDDVTVGVRYHAKAGPTYIGNNGILLRGTIIYGDVKIGDYFQSGHYTVIRAKVRLGNYCAVGNHSTLEGIIHCGEGVRIMHHVYIPTRTWFGDHVFVGPGVTFLNARVPLRSDENEAVGATIEDDVMIGGGCTIMGGVRIGERSFIAAGAVVTKDVPAKSFVKGVPGRIEPLPSRFDRVNDRRITDQSICMWHPLTPDLDALDWPERWGGKFRDSELASLSPGDRAPRQHKMPMPPSVR